MDGKQKNKKSENGGKTNIIEDTLKPASVNGEAAKEAVQLSKEEFEKVREHIETLQKEKEEYVSMAQRLQADFDNYRKRNSTLRTDSYDEGIRACMCTILPTLDNFDRALENAHGVDAAFVDGVALVYKGLLESLGKLGLQEIDAQCIFDENFHNAVMRESVSGKASGEIVEVLQKGYRANEKVLRYSMVKVAE